MYHITPATTLSTGIPTSLPTRPKYVHDLIIHRLPDGGEIDNVLLRARCCDERGLQTAGQVLLYSYLRLIGMLIELPTYLGVCLVLCPDRNERKHLRVFGIQPALPVQLSRKMHYHYLHLFGWEEMRKCLYLLVCGCLQLGMDHRY